MTCGIYKIINAVTGDFYIGRATNIEHRWISHVCSLSKNKNQTPKLQAAWNTYGAFCFHFEVLHECLNTENELYYWESVLIRKLTPSLNGSIPSKKSVLQRAAWRANDFKSGKIVVVKEKNVAA